MSEGPWPETTGDHRTSGDRRSHKRLDTFGWRYHLNLLRSAQDVRPCTLRNVSHGGIGLESAAKLKVGDDVRFWFDLYQPPLGSVLLQGQVCWIAGSEEVGHTTAGVEIHSSNKAWLGDCSSGLEPDEEILEDQIARVVPGGHWLRRFIGELVSCYEAAGDLSFPVVKELLTKQQAVFRDELRRARRLHRLYPQMFQRETDSESS